MKQADYYISGVWKNNTGIITDVMLHSVDEDNSFNLGVKTSELNVITLLKSQKKIKTITWNYPDWNIGATVIVVSIGSKEYLKTVPNATQKDNLDNSISMNSIK